MEEGEESTASTSGGDSGAWEEDSQDDDDDDDFNEDEIDLYEAYLRDQRFPDKYDNEHKKFLVAKAWMKKDQQRKVTKVGLEGAVWTRKFGETWANQTCGRKAKKKKKKKSDDNLKKKLGT